MRVPALLPDPRLVVVDHLASDATAITVVVHTVRSAVACPDCRRLAGRVHSRYTRTAADLPWNGIRVRLRVRSRKFFCDHPDCPRAIFCERLPGLLERYARRTQQLAQTLHWIGYLLGGEAGARLAVIIGVGVSPGTLLRLLRASAAREVATARVLGVDDWSLRRGRRYGSLLVDLEAGKVLDLLPDRRSETLAAWLKSHPGVEWLCRDRAMAYAEGARQGAPDAEQVVDRWHLLRNVSEALEAVVSRHRPALRAAASQSEPPLAPGAPPPSRSAERAGRPPPAPRSRSPIKRGGSVVALQRHLRREQVRQLTDEGFTPATIARRLGVSSDIVYRDLQSRECNKRRGGRRAAAGPYAAYLQERWRSGCHNAAQLHRELVAQGFTGSHDAVLRFVQSWRGPVPAPPRRKTARAAQQRQMLSRGQVPTPREVTWWLLSDARQHARAARAFLKQLLAECPTVAAAQRLTVEFFRIVRKRDLPALGRWFGRARCSGVAELKACASSLHEDRRAVAAALCHPFSNGPVEGQVNRLKLIKRQMYGRAKFDLLRARVLPIAP
jgi:transposase